MRKLSVFLALCGMPGAAMADPQTKAPLYKVTIEAGQHTLRSEMREKLAKISGILLAHSGLKLAVEGHTDGVGRESYNQTLSEKRAETVRDYLIEQGISDEFVSAQGFGKTHPLASNRTPEGRKKNRRVELVISGDLIEEKSGAKQ